MGARYREYLQQQNRSGSSKGMTIKQNELNQAFVDLDKILKHYRDSKWRKEIMGNAAGVLVQAARKRQGKAKQVHYFYSKGKRIRILPGNLKLSIQHLKNLKKTSAAVVGPRIKKKLGNLRNLGRSEKDTSGFYAWMAKRIYSGAESFRMDIMEPALDQVTPSIINYANQQRAKHHEKLRPRLSIFT